MSADRRKLLGFDQRARLEWMDAALGHIASGKSVDDTREALLDLLDGVVGGRRTASARSKTVTVLCRIWGGTVPGTIGLRNRALAILPSLSSQERVVLHWSMALVAYPFFADIAAIVGRLLELQNEAPMAHVTRRVIELWGDREKVRNAAPKVVRSMSDWGCLAESSKGTFKRPTPQLVARGELASLLAEALVFSGEQSAVPVPQLLRHPAAFPFQVELTTNDLRRSAHFEIIRQGLDLDVMSLRA
jgi:hypothetical protein